MVFKLKKKIILLILTTILLTLSGIMPVQQATAQVEDPLFTIYYLVESSDTTGIEVGELLKASMAEAGIELVIESVESGAYFSRTISQAGPKMLTHVEGGFDIGPMTYVQIPSDMIWYTGCFASRGIPPLGWNYWAMQSGIADDFLEAALSTYDREERLEAIYGWQDTVNSDANVIYLYHSTIPFLQDKRLKGFDPILLGYDSDEWTMDGFTEADDVTVTQAYSIDQPMWNPLFLNGGYLTLNLMYRTMWRVINDPVEGYITVPELAYAYEISDDGLTIDFFIREDIFFHDGVQLTSKDIVWTYEAILDPDTGATFHSDFSAAIASAEAIDDFTVRLHLAKISPEIFTLLGTYNTAILPEHILGEIPHADLRTHPTNTEEPAPGCGPYVFKEWARGEFTSYDAYDDYFLGRPFVDHIVTPLIEDSATALAALEAGDLTKMDTGQIKDNLVEVERIKNDNPDINTDQFVVAEYAFLAINNEHPILANKIVRQAISYLVPYDDIINTVLSGFAVPSSSFVAPTFWWFNPDTPYYTHDLDKAQELLALAGYPEWPPPEVDVEQQDTTIPMIYGAIAGLVIGAAVVYVLLKRST
jgi:ABC-type transport system substrate-binding protein